tara:strand:- start:21 stop:686 length:666 start_codon:yes stop_codon:yes gene_type:complete
MAIINVLLTDTFDTWRQKTNTLGTNQGDLANLDSSFAATDLVSALNEIKAGDDLTQLNLGDSTGLTVNRIRLGDSDDLQIYHDGSNSIINDAGDGTLQVQSGGTTMIDVTATGVTVTGDFATADNAAGNMLVGDGTHFEEVLMSGDATMASTGAVTIANDAITTAKILDGQVTSAKIADGTIATVDVADDAITRAKLASEVSLIIYDSAGTAVKTLYAAGA